MQFYTEADRHRDEEMKIGNLLKDSKRLCEIDKEVIIA
jgi:hypothetical protein